MFSILVFNLALLNFQILGFDVAKEPYVHERLGSLSSEILKQSDADILAFQEVFSKENKLLLKEQFQKTHPYAAYSEVKTFSLGVDTGLLILSKYPIIFQEFIPF